MTDLMRRRRALADGTCKVTFTGSVLEEASVHRAIAVHGGAGENRGQ
jgi:hypothetical protein